MFVKFIVAKCFS